MALILIRAMNNKKALNVLADLERHAKLNIVGKPKVVSKEKVYEVTKRVIKQKPRDDIKVPVLVQVKEDTTLSIINIKKTHPPAHVIVISEEYPEYEDLLKEFKKAKVFDGYYSSKKNKEKRKE